MAHCPPKLCDHMGGLDTGKVLLFWTFSTCTLTSTCVWLWSDTMVWVLQWFIQTDLCVKEIHQSVAVVSSGPGQGWRRSGSSFAFIERKDFEKLFWSLARELSNMSLFTWLPKQQEVVTYYYFHNNWPDFKIQLLIVENYRNQQCRPHREHNHGFQINH